MPRTLRWKEAEATPPDSAPRETGAPGHGGAPAAGAGASPSRAANAEVEAPADLEASAQQARHGGNYPLAAGLYRKAAALRHTADPATAAWDLAHAVECLAAAGLFDEARQVRQELSQLHPSEVTALAAAARRALREVDVPAADR